MASTLDRFHLMAVFIAVAEERSFAAGARRLGLSPPAVTRAITALERRLGVKLLTRTTRLVRVTEAGLRYLEDARRILTEVDEADEAAAGVNAAPRGHLAVTAPVLFGKLFITPGIVEYLRRYPEVQVSALFLDRVVNLLEEGVDVGVRIGDLPDSSLRAARVGQVRRVVCAAPEYLQRHGTPLTPAALAEHTVIAASGVSPSTEWTFQDGARARGVRLRPRLTVSSNDAAIEAALAGLGVTRLLSYQVAAYLATGRLCTVLDAYQPAPLPIHILHLQAGKYGAVKVRAFIDLIVARLRADPALR